MEQIKSILEENKPQYYTEYIHLYKEIKETLKKIKFDEKNKIKIAFLSSFTIKGIQEILTFKCLSVNIKPEFYLAPYNQYGQIILNENSQLYQFNPNLTILFIDLMSFLGDTYFSYYHLSIEDSEKIDGR